MTWQTDMTTIVRYLINDIDSTSYTDNRIQETIVVAAQLQYASIDFDNTYEIDVAAGTISPDPVTKADDWFINIVCMKAACIILNSESKTLAAQAYVVKDGPSSIDVGGAYRATSQLAKETCGRLAHMIMQYKAGDSVAGQAVLTPYTQEQNSGNAVNNFS